MATKKTTKKETAAVVAEQVVDVVVAVPDESRRLEKVKPEITEKMDIFQLKDLSDEDLGEDKNLVLLRDTVRSVENVKHDFIKLACCLYKYASNFSLLCSLGFTSTEDFAEYYFGIGRSTTYSLVGIAREFCNYGKGLLPPYEKFSQSQLVEMSALYPYQHRHITPDMTVNDIRDYKKGLKKYGSWQIEHVRNPMALVERYRNDYANKEKEPKEKKEETGPCADSILFVLRRQLENDNVEYKQDDLRTFLSNQTEEGGFISATLDEDPYVDHILYATVMGTTATFKEIKIS